MFEQLSAFGPDGTRLYVRRRAPSGPVPPGERTTALLCDGIACDGFIWKYLWDDLARPIERADGSSVTLDVAHWHYRGHGRSATPPDPDRLEFADNIGDLDAVRDALGDPPVILFGHSMGCQVALEGYRSRPDKVRGLVLICGSSGRITYTFRGTNVFAQLLPGVIARVDAHRDLVRAVFSRLPLELSARLALASGEVDARVRIEDLMPYLSHMVDIDLPMFLRMLRSAGEHSAEDLLPNVKVPTLVIAGDRDAFTPPQYAEAIAAAVPDAELMMVAGGTHVVPIERRELVEDRVRTFLRDRVAV